MTPRSTASLALASVLLVACGQATSTPVADDSEPTPSPTSSTPSPSTAVLTAVPEDIPLDVALPRPGSDITIRAYDDEPDSAVLDLCGPVPLDMGSIDLAGVAASGPEYAESRDLRLYETEEAAAEVIASVIGRLRRCMEETGHDAERVLERRESALAGDEAVTIVETYRYDGLPTLGATFREVVRVGNAVLLTTSYGEWDPQQNLDDGIGEHATDVAPIVAAMSVFDR